MRAGARLAAAVVATGLLVGSEAAALMPPHLTGVSPADGQLAGSRIELHGYSPP